MSFINNYAEEEVENFPLLIHFGYITTMKSSEDPKESGRI